MTGGLQALTVGRISVDLYPEQSGVPLARVDTFAKSVGGTATNVAVAAARLGVRSAVLTKVGDDGFAPYLRDALADFGVEIGYIGTADGLLTPLAFCELDPPEDPPLTFYRRPIAPDLTLTRQDVPWDLVRDVKLLWLTGTGVSTEPARSTQLQMLAHRGRPRDRWTVLDLDWRPMFWPSPEQAREQYEQMFDRVDVVVGNRTEIAVATGIQEHRTAAQALLDRGLRLVLVKLGAEGVFVATPERSSTVAPILVDVVCGLGAGDAFGGVLIHGLLAGWAPERIAEYGNAAGAILVSQLACADAMPTMPQLQDFLDRRQVRT